MTTSSTLEPMQDLCLAHLADEERCVVGLLEGVHHLREIVRAGAWSGLADALARLDSLVSERDLVHQRRGEIRGQLAAWAGEPGGLDVLARRLPPQSRARLNERRERLRSLARDLERETQTVAFLARHHLEFFDSFFVDLTRPAGAAPRYGREGQLQDSTPGSLIQVQG